MNTQLTEEELGQKVYWEDIFELLEEQQECWRQIYMLFERLRYQNADPRLLQQVSLTIGHMAEAFKALELLEPCFPQVPRAPVLSTNNTLPTIFKPTASPFKY